MVSTCTLLLLIDKLTDPDTKIKIAKTILDSIALRENSWEPLSDTVGIYGKTKKDCVSLGIAKNSLDDEWGIIILDLITESWNESSTWAIETLNREKSNG